MLRDAPVRPVPLLSLANCVEARQGLSYGAVTSNATVIPDS